MQEKKIRFQLVSGNTETVVYHTLNSQQATSFYAISHHQPAANSSRQLLFQVIIKGKCFIVCFKLFISWTDLEKKNSHQSSFTALRN